MPYYNLLQGIKNTPLAEMLLKWYNLTWSVGYIFSGHLTRENLCEPFGTPIPGGFSYIGNDFADVSKIVLIVIKHIVKYILWDDFDINSF